MNDSNRYKEAWRHGNPRQTLAAAPMPSQRTPGGKGRGCLGLQPPCPQRSLARRCPRPWRLPAAHSSTQLTPDYSPAHGAAAPGRKKICFAYFKCFTYENWQGCLSELCSNKVSNESAVRGSHRWSGSGAWGGGLAASVEPAGASRRRPLGFLRGALGSHPGVLI